MAILRLLFWFDRKRERWHREDREREELRHRQRREREERERRERKQEYHEYLKSDAWRRKRYVVLKRDKHRCQECGARAEQVHHLQYARNIGREPIDWLISICRKCHEKEHGIVRGEAPPSEHRLAQRANYDAPLEGDFGGDSGGDSGP